MNILSVHDYPPHVLGGAESQAARLVTEWLKAGHKVKSAAHRTPAGPIRLEDHDVQVHHISAASAYRLMRALKYSSRLAVWLLREARQADILYFRFLGEGALTAIMLKAAGLIRLPIVACPGCFGESGDARIIRSLPGWKWLIPLINRHCDAINILAEPIADELRALGIRDDHFVRIPNGIPVREIQPRTPSPPYRLLYAGRFESTKGLNYLLEAWAQLEPALRDKMHLSLAGDGSLQEKLEQQAKALAITGSVEFLGRVNNSDMRQLMESNDILILPSLEEGFSNTTLEALECAKPAAITRLGGIDQYFNEQIGWVMNPGNIADLKRVLSEIAGKDGDQIADMGSAARQFVIENFDITKTAEQHLQLFTELTEDNKVKP